MFPTVFKEELFKKIFYELCGREGSVPASYSGVLRIKSLQGGHLYLLKLSLCSLVIPANAWIVLKRGYDCFPPYPSQYSIHKFPCSTLHTV
jgi:hypothetical protein